MSGSVCKVRAYAVHGSYSPFFKILSHSPVAFFFTKKNMYFSELKVIIFVDKPKHSGLGKRT